MEQAPARPKSNSNKWILGCGIGAVLGFIILCVGGFFAAKAGMEWGRGKLSDAVHTELVAEINRSDIPDDQKVAMIAELDGLNADFKSGEVTVGQLPLIMEALTESPVASMILAETLKRQHIDPSGLTAEEKDQAWLTVQRVIRGLDEGSIEQAKVDDLLDPLQPDQTQQPTDANQPPQQVRLTDDELRQMIADARQLADEAEIPEEPYTPDYATALREAIAEAKQQTPAE